MRRGMFALALFLVLGSVAHGARVITFSPGGVMQDFIKDFMELRDRREPVVVDGLCLSACTLMLGILQDNQVCVTKRAVFGFHSARFITGEYAEEATRIMWFMYPDSVRLALKRAGWDGPSEHPEFVFVRGRDLGVYRDCTAADLR